MVKQKRLFMLSLLLLMLTGCGMSEELTDWAAEKANDAFLIDRLLGLCDCAIIENHPIMFQ